MAEVVPLAPEYRYFTVDLLTNEILAEIPFRGVTWERAIKGAGAFSGKIPVIKDTEALDLYDTTLPGKTGLYVVRNNECVWGGIIWDRVHDVISHDLSVSASEFSSYLYHRKIWKTWNHQFGATVSILPDELRPGGRNYIPSPQGTSSTNWGARWFGGGGATGTRSYGLSSTPGNMPTNTKTFARKQWTSDVTIPNMGDSGFQVGPEIPAVPGEVWTLGGYMRTDSIGTSVGARIQLRTAGVIAGNVNMDKVVTIVVPDQWTYVELTFTIPDTIDAFIPILDVYVSGSTSGWAIGNYLDATGVMLDYASTYRKTFFDGSVPAQNRRVYSWSGTAGASTSIEQIYTRVGGKVALDYGSDVTVLPGSSVLIEFYDPKDFQYNGFYRVSGDPAPTSSIFEIISGQSLVDVSSVEVRNNIAYVTTESKHGFNTGDLITLDVSYGLPFIGTFEITAPGGSYTDLFTFPVSSPNLSRTVTIGTATRPLPPGVYRSATVTVRTDTYDYIRNLVSATFKDFVGTDFPNVYIEPGISYGMDITSAGITGGLATIETAEAHNLAVGQAVQIKNLSPLFDGEYEVTQIPSDTAFRYSRSGEVAQGVVTPRETEIYAVELKNGVATMYTNDPHPYLAGQTIEMFLGYNYDTLNGTFQIDTVPTTRSFTYIVPGTGNIPITYLTESFAFANGKSLHVVASELTANKVTLTVQEELDYKVGDRVEIVDVNRSVPIIEKSYDAPNDLATITTSVPHKLPAETGSNLGQVGRTNLIENPSFGLDTAGWASAPGTGGAMTLSRFLQFDRYSLRGTFTTAPTTPDSGLFYYTLGKVPVTPGQNYFASVQGSVSWTGAGTRAVIRWYSSAGTLLSSNFGETVNQDDPYTWGESGPPPGVMYGTGPRYVTAVAPTSAAYGRVDYQQASGTLPTVGSYMSITAAQILQTSNYSYNTIIRGEYDGNPADSYYSTFYDRVVRWNGVAHASTSSEYYIRRVQITGVRDRAEVIRKQSLAGSPNKMTLTTRQGHNFGNLDIVNFGNIRDEYIITARSLTSNVATVTVTPAHNISVNPYQFRVANVIDNYSISSKMLSDNKATLTTTLNHNLKVNDSVTVTGVIDKATVVSKTAENGIAILTMSRPHNFIETEEITVSGVGAPFDGKVTVLSFTDTRVFYEIPGESLILPAKSSGMITGTNSIFNGEFPIVSVTSNSFTYQRSGEDVSGTAASGKVSALSVINGEWPILSMTANTVSFAVTGNNLPNAVIPVADEEGELQAVASANSVMANGAGQVIQFTRNTITVYVPTLAQVVPPTDISAYIDTDSDFNGSRRLATITSDTFQSTGFGLKNNVLEESVDTLALATARYVYNGNYIITGVDYEARTFSYTRAWPFDILPAAVQNRGKASVRPVSVVSTFGPYPGNADLDFKFSTQRYSGINIEPIAYRGYELMTVGEALDAYSDSIDGFEYRIDCEYDPIENRFSRTFVLIPINFPNPPAPGDVSPLSRFGADKLVFEYPGGSITDMQISESAENSATRFFAVGENNLGPDAGPPMSIASAEDLLAGTNGVDEYRKWPLLDESEKIDDIDDEAVLYSYAQRYLTENRPPDANLTISVNGSIAPIVGTYFPGDWCSLIVDDAFVRMRLASDLEPRNDVMVRKIDSYKVTVPDGSTFPEKVALTLVPEWEVDKRGKSSV